MLVILLFSTGTVRAEDSTPFARAEATAYVIKGITSSGAETRTGICASSRPEWKGKTLALYQRNGDELGEFIGYYECLDSGCHVNVIDVWCEDLDQAQAFMNRVYENGCNGHIFVQVIDAQG